MTTSSLLKSVSTLALTVAVAGILCASEAAAQTTGTGGTTDGTSVGSGATGGVSPGTGTAGRPAKKSTARRAATGVSPAPGTAGTAGTRGRARAGIAPPSSGIGPSGVGRSGAFDSALHAGVTGPRGTGLGRPTVAPTARVGSTDLTTGLGGPPASSGLLGGSTLFAPRNPPTGLSTGTTDTLSSQRALLPPAGFAPPPSAVGRGAGLRPTP